MSNLLMQSYIYLSMVWDWSVAGRRSVEKEEEKREESDGQTIQSKLRLFFSAASALTNYCIMLASLRSVARPLARCATSQGKLNYGGGEISPGVATVKFFLGISGQKKDV